MLFVTKTTVRFFLSPDLLDGFLHHIAGLRVEMAGTARPSGAHQDRCNTLWRCRRAASYRRRAGWGKLFFKACEADQINELLRDLGALLYGDLLTFWLKATLSMTVIQGNRAIV